MLHFARTVLVCCLLIAGCSSPQFKGLDGKRLRLPGYDRLSVRPVEVAAGIDYPGLSEELGAKIQNRLSQSKRWTLATSQPSPAGSTQDSQLDLTVLVVKAKYPSRAKSIWLGAAHKMTCRVQVRDHATGDPLGTAKVSSSVEPLMGNAGLLNFGVPGILGRTMFDTREHDMTKLHERIAKEIVQALDRAKR